MSDIFIASDLISGPIKTLLPIKYHDISSDKKISYPMKNRLLMAHVCIDIINSSTFLGFSGEFLGKSFDASNASLTDTEVNTFLLQISNSK